MKPFQNEQEDVKDAMLEMGVNLFEPSSRKEETMAQALEAFSSFVLEEEPAKCHSILEKHMEHGDCVGELQGGSDQSSIYRVLLPQEEEDDQNFDGAPASGELFREFYSSNGGKQFANVFTVKKLRQYMLGMCEKRSQLLNEVGTDLNGRKQTRVKYTNLGNLMLILSFGSIWGQVRHIDDMVSNVQICLYMSSNCPSTRVYEMAGSPIRNGKELLEFWESEEGGLESSPVPKLIQDVLVEKGDMPLKRKWYCKSFKSWGTINLNLQCFGKLYQTVANELTVMTDPGTTLLAGGNEVHAGPACYGPRMFAFAIGIPEQQVMSDDGENYNEEKNGEVQYSSVLFHIDLCCILFSILDFEYPSHEKALHDEAKQFLIQILIRLLKDYPNDCDTFCSQINDERDDIRTWLDLTMQSLGDRVKCNEFLQAAVSSDSIFYSSEVKKRRTKLKGRMKRRKET
jgi:hypothetical protein